MSATRTASSPIALAFATMFGLQPAQAEILATLYTQTWLSARKVHICAIRRALEAEAVDTQHGRYRLTESGRLECQSALAQFSQWVQGVAA